MDFDGWEGRSTPTLIEQKNSFQHDENQPSNPAYYLAPFPFAVMGMKGLFQTKSRWHEQ